MLIIFVLRGSVLENSENEGYWWLAFDWKNYRYFCTWCNQRRIGKIHCFIGTDWQDNVVRVTGNRIFTPLRTNQPQQNPTAFNRLLGKFRERIEGVFHEIQNTGRHLAHLLRKHFGIDGLTFIQHPLRNRFTLT